MTHQKNSIQQHMTRAPKSSQSMLGLTAAMIVLMAGTPAGLAQDAQSNATSNAIGSLKSFFGGESQSGTPADAKAQAQPTDQDEFRTDGLYYDEDKTIEMHVQDESLVNVLQMLSIQSERNIIASNDVSARVTANLYGVTFREALDAILHVNGYGYIERGNFIYVYPIEVLDQIEEASRKRVAKVLRLNFLSAVDAADFVSDLLSDEGSIKSNGKMTDWTEPSTPVGNENFANESTLVVFDYPENIEAIEKLVSELDTRPAQILVEATIVQTSINEDNAFGVDFSIIADLNFSEFASPLGVFDGVRKGGTSGSQIPADGAGTVATSRAGNTAGAGTFKAGLLTNNVAVFLNALDEVADTTIISNPKVVTLNRQPGRVLVGRKVGYLQSTATQTSTTQTVEFLDTGTQLNYRPFVTSNGLIRMELLPRVSEAVLRSATDVTGAAVTIPDENTNELSANVLVPDGHTIVLGGLFREATTATRRQVPVLGDIPIIGSAFRGHEDSTQRQEIIFLITPSIVSDQVLVDQGIRAEESVQQVRAGAREGLLPFSRDRQAAQLLVEAEHLTRDGKTDEALHKIRRSLKLNANQPEAIALREKLVNERDIWPSNSLLDKIINQDAKDTLEHNILENGWFGATSKVENAPKKTTDTYASKSTQRNTKQHTRKAGSRKNVQPTKNAKSAMKRKTPAFERNTSKISKSQSHAAKNQSKNRSHGTFAKKDSSFAPKPKAIPQTPDGQWWNSSEFLAFVMTYNWAVAQEQSHAQIDETNEWWSTPEFQAFMTTYNWAVAQEKGQGQVDPTNEWWNSSEFQAFLATYNWAVAQEQGVALVDPNNEWWNSPEFQAFMSTFGWMNLHEDAAKLILNRAVHSSADATDAATSTSPEASSKNTSAPVQTASESATPTGANDWSEYNDLVENAFNEQATAEDFSNDDLNK